MYPIGDTDSRVIRTTIPSHHIVRMAERLAFLANKSTLPFLGKCSVVSIAVYSGFVRGKCTFLRAINCRDTRYSPIASGTFFFHIFSSTWKETIVIILPKSGNDTKFAQNLLPTSLLPMTSQMFEKVILKIVQRHIEDRKLLNGVHFDFRARHCMAVQCVRLTAHVTLNFNSNTAWLRYSSICVRNLWNYMEPCLLCR